MRINTAVTEPDGTTTKINEPGLMARADDLDEVAARLAELAEGATWVVLSGSLPPGAPSTGTRGWPPARLPGRRRHLRAVPARRRRRATRGRGRPAEAELR
ncbi:hypothetical protein [Tessaracoccus coleopterorum]|uniref:hypothetical protein n=1 Tax=Tessaracoccus coleopterorum TaxID=2714950 RepID=UPI0018D3C72F|nr:hypothetical protein [Tessaracoccus coleopterorum]